MGGAHDFSRYFFAVLEWRVVAITSPLSTSCFTYFPSVNKTAQLHEMGPPDAALAVFGSKGC